MYVTCWGLALVFVSRRFFQTACDVPELQDKFNVDEYSDLVTLTKPVIYISIGEIINTHTVCGFLYLLNFIALSLIVSSAAAYHSQIAHLLLLVLTSHLPCLYYS